MTAIPAGPFGLIVADPPWRFLTRSDKDPSRCPDAHYPCMSLDEIKSLPVAAACEKDAIMALWTTASMLAAGHAHYVACAWGFSPVTTWSWVKTTAAGGVAFGMGYYGRNGHEPILICRRGKGLRRENRGQSDVIMAQRGRHSQKPEALQDRLELMFPFAERLELFARRQRPGWTCWGNEL